MSNEQLPHQLAESVNAVIQTAQQSEVVKRIWRKDAALWKADESSQKIIKNALGWLKVPDEMLAVADELMEFADLIRNRGFKHVMVCGMGGSSLCPEVLARTFGPQAGYPELLVLDSTDPDVISDLANRIEIEHCLFVISSKSGSTTEPNVFYKFWYDQVSKRSSNPGENFIAITDPGSPMVEVADTLGFQRTFLNQADIGGRSSALSYFGMVPAVLMGIDVRKLLERAKHAQQMCSAVMPVDRNPALRLGAIMGECQRNGRDKLTLILDPKIETLGLWIEQLVAESTGKEGKGILPVAGEALGQPLVYGADRLFVSVSVGPTNETKQALELLSREGHPIVYRELADFYDLAAEFFIWEFATACAGWRMEINPFDQPNVQESKDATKNLLEIFSRDGKLPEQTKLVADDRITLFVEGATGEALPQTSVFDALQAHTSSIKTGDYVSFLIYSEETSEVNEKLNKVRLLLRDSTRCATTIGYGPRFLHSTGQLHKGGTDEGVFFQITAGDKTDFAVPGEPYTFNVLKQAQALGDFHSLATRGRRAVRVDLGNDVGAGLTRFLELISQTLARKASL